MSKHYDYCFTINNPTLADIEKLPHDARYLVYGSELAPETGTPHLQGYVYFHNPRSIKAVQDQFHPHHIEPRFANSSPEAASNYCKKDGDYQEFGHLPVSQRTKGQLSREMHEEAWQLAVQGQIEAIHPSLRIRYLRTFEHIYFTYGPQAVDLETRPTYGKWIYGPTRSGKSHLSRSHTPYYLKPKNKWWDNYRSQTYVIIDELDPSDAGWMTSFLKVWVDKWTFPAEYKGGTRVIRPYEIIITSNYSPDQVFLNQDLAPILARFEVIYKDIIN